MNTTEKMILLRRKDADFPGVYVHQEKHDSADELVAEMQAAMEGETYRDSQEYEVLEVVVKNHKVVKREVQTVATVKVEEG